MKKLFLALAIGLIAMGCDERDPDKDVNPNVLPPATQVGANTGGCLVDGKVWVASKKYRKTHFTFKENIHYTLVGKNGFFLKITLYNVKNGNEQLIIEIKKDEPLKLNYEYILEEDDNDYLYGVSAFWVGKQLYRTSNNHKGKLIITHINEHTRTISGVFEINLQEVKPVFPREYGEKLIKITEGRFDKKYES